MVFYGLLEENLVENEVILIEMLGRGVNTRYYVVLPEVGYDGFQTSIDIASCLDSNHFRRY